ncbi:EboA domain-containing protein [Chondrinema litorale]|uniref:EboA domain-containing protein n=1 Tax=Chondrinema litorale TaxID=2994555 RepID=UPI002542C0A7|nr:EboA domain-containing protein [Chondrinema litorale]UZR94122.1 EboA domain-containing protein [Chondrinema litorale]
MESRFQADIDNCIDFLLELLNKTADNQALTWLQEKVKLIKDNPAERNIFINFSLASRFFSKDKILLSSEDLEKAQTLRKGFNPTGWNALQVARTIVLLNIPYQDSDKQLKTLNQLFESADVAELVTLYAALPLLPNPEIHAKRASEGIRTNMTVVLDAVVLNNPFSAEYMDDISWNQLVLKTIFTERPVFMISGADERANERLALTLSDYAHERWAAGRKVTPELWRFTGQFAEQNLLKDYKILFEQGSQYEKAAALLACKESTTNEAKELVNKFENTLTKKFQNWDELGNAYLMEKGELPSGYQQAGSGVSTQY